jgi:nucleoside-diphosphate-sugar epimerase
MSNKSRILLLSNPYVCQNCVALTLLTAHGRSVINSVKMECASLPDCIKTQDELDILLSRPSVQLLESIGTFSSPLVIVGAGGKLGPTLSVMARRAADAAGCAMEVIAVSRFNNTAPARAWLEQRGVKTLSCDLLRADSIRHLPDSENVIYLAGQKFGTGKSPAATWAVNVVASARVAERYSRARLVALSTANVYPLSEVSKGGSMESDPLTPLGEYANSAVGRERVLEFFSLRDGIPLVLLRLCYAVELRYGVLLDIAQKVHGGKPIDLANGYFNCIWQGDANDLILRSLSIANSPPTIRNLCRPEVFSVRSVAEQLGELLGQSPKFAGSENPNALLCNARPLCEELGEPPTALAPMLRWTADWVRRGGRTLGKPTGFEVRDGKY